MNVRLKNVGDGNLRLARHIDVNLYVRPRIKNRSDPIDKSAFAHARHLAPVRKDKDERPTCRDPANRAPQTHGAEFLPGVSQIGKGNGISNGNCRDIEKRVHEQQ